jgi:hypothetical protein
VWEFSIIFFSFSKAKKKKKNTFFQLCGIVWG